MGNRRWGSGRERRAPLWAKALVVVIGVCLVILGFYLAIRLSMDVGYGNSGT